MGAAFCCQPQPTPTVGEVRLTPRGAATTLLSQQRAAGKGGASAGRKAAEAEEAAALQFARRASQVDCSKPRMLLVSDNLPRHELLLSAVKQSTVAVPVQYAAWTLGELRAAIVELAGEPKEQFQTVGILDHGGPGEFCLLESVCGGTLDQQKVQRSEEAQRFLKFLAGFVQAPRDPARWRERLDARIDLMNCSVYAGKGEDFVTYLEDLTQVKWAASKNKTGFGSDWIMESEECLGDIAACYFREAELLQWKFTAEKPASLELKSIAEKHAGQGHAMSFTDGVVGVPGQPCVVSFPGIYEGEWNNMVAMVILSKAMMRKVRDRERAKALFSTACVFLPEGDEHFGCHWTLGEREREERREGPEYTGPCYCSKLYNVDKKPWGCYWFQEWRRQLEKAHDLGQKLVVVYKKKQKGQGDEVEWGELPPFAKDAKGLGGSQRGEVAWIKKKGWRFDKVDVTELSQDFKSKMYFGSQELYRGHARELAEAIHENAEVQRGLRNLVLRENIAPEDQAALFEAVGECSALTVLRLNDCGLELGGMEQLAKALPAAGKLTHLGLNHNRLGDAGAIELCKLLPQLPALSSLGMGSAMVGDEGALALAETFAQCPALTVVWLRDNPIGSNAKQAIMDSKKGLKVTW